MADLVRLSLRDRAVITMYRAIESAGVMRTPGGRELFARAYEAYKRVTDRSLVRYARGRIRQGDVAVDVGAHLGSFTAQLLSMVGRHGRVIAFEADPRSAAALRARLGDRRGCEIREVAIGDSPGASSLYRGVFPADSHLYPDTRSRNAVTVAVERLDDALDDVVPAFVKIDVQGGEAAVLRGMPRLLAAQGLRTVLVEFWPEGLLASGSEPSELYAAAQAGGLRPRDPVGGGHMLLEDALTRCTARGYVDVAFERPEG